MNEVLTDKGIAKLVAEPKLLQKDYQSRIQLKPKRGHKERELDLKGNEGSDFRLIFRQSDFNALDFSVILAFLPPSSNQLIRLRRYSGKSHMHTNKLENQTFYDYHIHITTERYQSLSLEMIDAYAEPTDRYSDFHGAVKCMLADCSFDIPQEPQQSKGF
ncbi:hypothetical protein GF359_03665 [candidate division WOR-3 bacterium]|uniref:Uncharacterized protein n=1 Tax=candidate division WOR-3 bacterium TaxID=2052148 RepID=A0A9D5K8B8_UNCW3|nr:hypothetical protein [candidate division WOR-3 bacterium]MBD3364293.1 hypothetical protein [candidate division WOR-3 bacterium]